MNKDEDYSDIVMKPPYPQLNIEDYGGPKHQFLINFYRDAITKLLDRQKQWKKVGRNAPCPCGSGKKYKKCHGATV